MNGSPGDDQAAIDRLVTTFFSLFTNADGATPAVARVYDLCIPEAVIIKAAGGAPEVCGLRNFVAPREALLRGGTLVDFAEVETSAQTDIFGDIAQRRSLYRKSGVLAGRPFATRGVKVFQFVRLGDAWRISALAWDDERDGCVVPDTLR